MRCRLPIKASAVVLYTGWLLMLPPFDGHGSVDTDAPLSRWAHFISYDTAKACQDALVSACGFDQARRWQRRQDVETLSGCPVRSLGSCVPAR